MLLFNVENIGVDTMYNLGSQFVYDINKARANTACVFVGKTYRISVITERLIRIEYNKQGIFEDRQTQNILYRNFEAPKVNVMQDNRYLEIISKYFRLEYLKEGKINSTRNLKIFLLSTDKIWYYKHPEVRNFEGTMMSLDDYNKNSDFGKSLYSDDGFVTIDDSKSMVINEDGTITKRESDVQDIYIFMYRKDFGLCLKDYFNITGYPPLIPRYALGNWWCRNYPYNEAEINKLFLRFSKESIPMSIFLLDKDWHVRNVDNKKNLLTGYTFNTKLLPNFSSVINNLHNKGIRIGLYNNPVEGIHTHENMYLKCREYLGGEENKSISFAPYDPKYIDVYLKLLLHPLEGIGVDFFWNDYYNKNDKNTSFILSHYNFLDSNRNESKRGMLLMRNSTFASHRYGILYSGKTTVSFKTLKLLPFYNSSSSNIGLSWWSHDIGGYYSGIEDNELYLRYVQLGCFSPIFRIHVDGGKYYKREPWRWDVQTFEITKYYMQLRHKLVPYLYTEAYKYSKDGIPLIQPLYYKHPDIYDKLVYRNEYYLGSEMLVSPITDKKDLVMNRVIHKFYLPSGLWYDFKTGKKFPGDRAYVSFFKDEDYPVFVKSGSIIPIDQDIKNNTDCPNNLELHIFPGRSNIYNLYEDDGVSNLYKQGYFLKTSFDYNYQENNYTIIVRAVEGKSGIVPEKRNYKFRFRNVKKTSDLFVNFNGKELNYDSYEEENDFIIEVPSVPTIGQLTINCRGKAIEIDAVRLINEEIDGIIYDIPIETRLKEQISQILFSDLPIKKKRIKIRRLKNDKLDEKFIKMFLRLLEYIQQI